MYSTSDTLTAQNQSRGSLILVNRSHCIEKDRPVRSALVPVLLAYPKVLMQTKAAACLHALLTASGCLSQVVLVSGYRSFEEQRTLYETSLAENGPAFTDQFVAPAGCSEHETGLAIDLAGKSDFIDFICPDFPEDGIFADFRSLAGRYGFVQRYAKDKEHITGIACEPWHFRYVGYPHSELMAQKNLCLEEYIDYLRCFSFTKPLSLQRSGKNLRIFCQEVSSQMPEITGIAEISGSNAGECIVTVWS